MHYHAYITCIHHCKCPCFISPLVQVSSPWGRLSNCEGNCRHQEPRRNLSGPWHIFRPDDHGHRDTPAIYSTNYDIYLQQTKPNSSHETLYEGLDSNTCYRKLVSNMSLSHYKIFVNNLGSSDEFDKWIMS